MSIGALSVILSAVVAIIATGQLRQRDRFRRRRMGVFRVVVAILAAGLIAGLLLPGVRRAASHRGDTVASAEWSRSSSTSAGSTVDHDGFEISVDRTLPPPDPSPAADPGSAMTGTLPPVAPTPRADVTDSPRIANLIPPRLQPWFAVGAFAVLAALAYLFLDAPRRGRYAVGLRIGYAILFVGLCVCIWELGPLKPL